MNDIMVAIIEKFNEEHGKTAVKLLNDDEDSFIMEFKNEEMSEKLKTFIKDSTKKVIMIQPVENIFSKNFTARIFFERTTADDVVEALRKYEEGTPPRELETCPDCGSTHGEKQRHINVKIDLKAKKKKSS